MLSTFGIDFSAVPWLRFVSGRGRDVSFRVSCRDAVGFGISCSYEGFEEVFHGVGFGFGVELGDAEPFTVRQGQAVEVRPGAPVIAMVGGHGERFELRPHSREARGVGRAMQDGERVRRQVADRGGELAAWRRKLLFQG